MRRLLRWLFQALHGYTRARETFEGTLELVRAGGAGVADVALHNLGVVNQMREASGARGWGARLAVEAGELEDARRLVHALGGTVEEAPRLGLAAEA